MGSPACFGSVRSEYDIWLWRYQGRALVYILPPCPPSEEEGEIRGYWNPVTLLIYSLLPVSFQVSLKQTHVKPAPLNDIEHDA